MDLRRGACPLCLGGSLLRVKPAGFGDADMEHEAALTYGQAWLGRSRSSSKPHGPLELWVCRACGLTQEVALNPDEVPIDEGIHVALIRGSGDPVNPGRRPLMIDAPVLSWDDEGLRLTSLSTPDAAIRWASPFSVSAARAPRSALSGPVADVHLTLRQATPVPAEIALTLCLTDRPAFDALPTLVALLPRVEGVDASDVFDLIDEMSRALGAPVLGRAT